MNSTKKQIAIAVICLIFIFSGCAGLTASKGKSSQSSKPLPKEKPTALYYDFNDVLIPANLKLDTKSSFIFKAGDIAAGVIILKGRGSAQSLINFFEANMSKDNWQRVSEFKSKRAMMLFYKENKWCVINIKENDFSGTNVEIWVAPTNQDIGLIK